MVCLVPSLRVSGSMASSASSGEDMVEKAALPAASSCLGNNYEFDLKADSLGHGVILITRTSACRRLSNKAFTLRTVNNLADHGSCSPVPLPELPINTGLWRTIVLAPGCNKWHRSLGISTGRGCQ
ncbi:uncharacterized protein B0T23DRAFT_56250 [Neurospora hispaniola]|uniref:Uncharacterized protein n=1 Tax=Neurospora hispaniola TaxID=588809 RepID=A0AAJ0HXN9_9PEZI|nr:hypothetical protein B0T23DRAFT_56250 [Neurospora hispaniola]